eukprot:365619-Chlamydomonas_euryale.AAC.24
MATSQTNNVRHASIVARFAPDRACVRAHAQESVERVCVFGGGEGGAYGEQVGASVVGCVRRVVVGGFRV